MRRILFGALLLLLSCDPIDDSLEIWNSSSKRVYYMTSCHENLVKDFQLTLEEQGIELNYLNVIDTVAPLSSKKEAIVGKRGEAWKAYIRKCDNGILRVYLFNIDTLVAYDFRDIAINNKYLVKKEYSLDDLQRLNWRIELP